MTKESFRNRLGRELKEQRKHQKITQVEAAAAGGVSRPTITLLERGRGRLSSFLKVVEALELKLVGRNLPAAPNLGGRVAALRNARGLSQRGLAGLVGCSQPTILALEKGLGCRFRVFDAVLQALGAGAYLAPKESKEAFYSHAGNSSAKQTWRTPKWLLEKLYSLFGEFDLDPCSSTDANNFAPVKARIRFTERDDGLSLPWFGNVFMNPPYGRMLGNWISKARQEVEEGRAACVIGLIPARPDTTYWHEHIANNATVLFLRGRLRFDDGQQSAPFPSALIVWGGGNLVGELRELFSSAWVSGAHR